MSNTTYGELRSLLSHIDLDRYQIVRCIEGLETPDLREAGYLAYVSEMVRRSGQDVKTAEINLTVEVGRKTVYKHLSVTKAVKALMNKGEGRVRRVSVTPILKPGMEISEYINGDSYGCIITKVDTQKRIWVASLREARAEMANGMQLDELPSTCWTRRQKRDSGKRGWAVKGSGIDSIRYSGLNFRGAVDKLDPHF